MLTAVRWASQQSLRLPRVTKDAMYALNCCMRVTVAGMRAYRPCHCLQVSSYFDAQHPLFDPYVTPTILPIYWAEETAEASVADTQDVVRLYRVCPFPPVDLPHAVLVIRLTVQA